jgi:hypothetical protein
MGKQEGLRNRQRWPTSEILGSKERSPGEKVNKRLHLDRGQGGWLWQEDKGQAEAQFLRPQKLTDLCEKQKQDPRN